MSLRIQSFRLSEGAKLGMGLGGFAAGTERGGTPAVRAIDQCFHTSEIFDK